MASSPHAATGMLLSGAPDTYIGSKSIPPASRGKQVMQLELNQDVLDELLSSIRNGTPPKLLLGHNPVRIVVVPAPMSLDPRLTGTLYRSFSMAKQNTSCTRSTKSTDRNFT